MVMKETKQVRKGWLTVRLNEDEEKKLNKFFSRTTSGSLSEYARDVLLKEPVNIIYRNQSADEFLAEMILLKKELNAIGNNFNQAVKNLHTLNQISEFRHWLVTYEIEKKILFNKMDEIKNHIRKIGEKWLQ